MTDLNMNYKNKPRIEISSYDKRSRKEYVEKRKYFLPLCETELAIIKAALQYWLLDDSFGYRMFSLMDGASFGTSDRYYSLLVIGTSEAEGLMDTLDKLSSVEPLFSEWCDIDDLFKKYQKEIVDSKATTDNFSKKCQIKK